uniref:C-type mannose receptor 2-like n=2 Tax=Acanthochromis polyacanthus TaxID=80966 RepID=A0A3Q1EDT7_9TELE
MFQFCRMRKSLLLAVIFSGLSVLSTNLIREYHYVKSFKNWTDAQRHCREVFTDLATVENQYDNKRLLSVMQKPKKWAYIGLYDDLVRWKWVLGNADFNNNLDFSNWNSKEPNNLKSKQHCVAMSKHGLWFDWFCSRRHPAVCFNENGTSKYILVKSKMSWYQAKNYCSSNYTDLASVRNTSENSNIKSLLSNTTWIGLHRNFWSSWSDQTPATFTNWKENQPDNNGKNPASCAVVSPHTGRWSDVYCQIKRYFVCQSVFYPQNGTTFKLRFQSEANLDHPDIQHHILQQLHAELEANGLGNYTLRWIQTDGRAFHKEQKKDKEPGKEERYFSESVLIIKDLKQLCDILGHRIVGFLAQTKMRKLLPLSHLLV